MSARLIAYFPLADASVPVALLDLYADTGVDIVEFGWPAKDPFLDGPDVRGSMARARSGDPRAAFDAARRQLAKHALGPKALIMTYAEEGHPALADPNFYRNVDGTLVLGPPGGQRRAAMEADALRMGTGVSAFLPLPFSEGDVASAMRADFYVMLQAAPGVTGPRGSIEAENAVRIAALRTSGVTAPIMLGFGISNGAQARAAVGFGADGVVVGSAILRAALAGRGELETLLKDLREGLDG